MKYLLLACGADDVEPSEEVVAASAAWADEMSRRGVREFGGRLRPAEDASTVRVRDGEVLVSDGPFAELKEQIGGVDVLDCADLDEALQIAAQHPAARLGTVEIRPFWTS